MEINKANIWSVLDKYDCKEHYSFCDSLSRLIQGKSDSGDLLDIFVHLEKIEKSDRDIIENEIGNNITAVLFCI